MFEGRTCEDASERRNIPVPIAMSATLRGEVEVVGSDEVMLGWRRKPRALVVRSCCSLSLLLVSAASFWLWLRKRADLSAISSAWGKTLVLRSCVILSRKQDVC